MINNQALEKVVGTSDVDLHSMFDTIQGEGPFSGRRATFIRLAGCNLKCPMCDTEYTEGRRWVPFAKVAHDANSRKQGLIVITGGEPLRQPVALSRLVRWLLAASSENQVQIETNGALPFPAMAIAPRCFVVVSPKTDNISNTVRNNASAFKYVISADSVDPEDGLPLMALGNKVKRRVARPTPGVPVYVQPADEPDGSRCAANMEAAVNSALRFGYTLQLQIHKYARLP